MKSRLVPYLLLSILAIILVLGAIIVFGKMIAPSGCNYDDANISYINKNPDCIINFMCMKDHTAFRDECGCGCRLNP